VVQQLLEEQDTVRSLVARLAESDDALTAAAEEVAALRQMNGGERPTRSMQNLIEDLHERVRPNLVLTNSYDLNSWHNEASLAVSLSSSHQ
jgi:hypothetical protein